MDVMHQIIEASGTGGKTYAFDSSHDPTKPAQWWFQDSEEGLVLFIVFYTQACRWSKCLGCNLPSKCSLEHVDYEAIMAQVDHVFSLPEIVQKRDAIHKVIISNNGNVLDEETFSSTALVYLFAKLNLHFPYLAVVSMETRPEYIDEAELEFLSRVIREGKTPTDLELAIGFEAFDDRIRNEVFNKGLTIPVFEKVAAMVAEHNFRLKCYFMQKPVPGMSDQEAVQDIRDAIDFISDIAVRHQMKMNMHLNPTYVAYGTRLEESFRKGAFTPPRLADVLRATTHARGKMTTVFVGLYDEGLAVPGGSFIREGDEETVRKLERFNRTQDFRVLDA